MLNLCLKPTANVVQKLVPPILFLICVIDIILWTIFFPLDVEISTPWNYLGLPYIAFGFFMVQQTRRLFKKENTEIHTFKTPNRLITHGFFRYTRNPIYVGFSLVLFGIVLLTGQFLGLITWSLFVCLVNWWYIPHEEQQMQTQFGEAFTAYQNKVRRWI